MRTTLQLRVVPICSFVWALVHSPDPAHVERGLDLAQSMIKAAELEQQGLNDLVYLSAVVSEPCTYIAQMLPTGLQILPNHVHVCKTSL